MVKNTTDCNQALTFIQRKRYKNKSAKLNIKKVQIDMPDCQILYPRDENLKKY